jgi:hypothetical protein
VLYELLHKFSRSECTQCEWYFTTYNIGSDKVNVVYLDIHGALLLSPIVVVALVFVFELWLVSIHRLEISFIVLFSTIDDFIMSICLKHVLYFYCNQVPPLFSYYF